MRCAEVIRELAAPSDQRDALALAEHLAGCRTCAAWNQQATRLDQLWKASKPEMPSSEVWEAMWANIAGSLETPLPVHEAKTSAISELAGNSPVGSLFDSGVLTTSGGARMGRRSLAVFGLIGVAQAAAIFVAVALAWQHPGSDRNQGGSGLSANTSVSVDVEEGRVVLIRSEGQDTAVIDMTPDELVYGVDAWYLMFNQIEWMANPIVAMKE